MVMTAASAAHKRFGPGMACPPVCVPARNGAEAAKTLKSVEMNSTDLNEIRGPRAALAGWGAMPGLPKVPAAEKIDVDEKRGYLGAVLSST